MDTQTQIDRLIELAIIQRSELKQLVEQLPQLREHLNSEVEKVFDETEPQLRAELEEWTTKQTADKTAALGVALEAKIADLAKSLEVSTQARYNTIIAEREENARIAAQAEAKIAEHAASLPGAVKEIVTAELARFPRAGEIEQLRKEFAEPRGLNPRGKWQAGESYSKLDFVTINGDSYASNIDNNRTRPSRSSADWTLVAARGTGGGGGPTSLSELTTVPSDGDVLIGSGTSWVTSNLTAGAGISITVGPGAITISATDGDITLDDGTAASPSLHFTNDPDTGIYRPAANTLGISVSGTQVAYFDENGLTVPSAGVVAGGSFHGANGNANNPSYSFTGDQDTGFFRHQPNEIGIALGGTQYATLTSTTFSITPVVTMASSLRVNGTTDSSSKDTGAIVTEGGLGVEKSATFGGNLTVSGGLVTLNNATESYVELKIAGTTKGYLDQLPSTLNVLGMSGVDVDIYAGGNNPANRVAKFAASGIATTLYGNLTVSGTGTSTVAGKFYVAGATAVGNAGIRADTGYNIYFRNASTFLGASYPGAALDALDNATTAPVPLALRGSSIYLENGDVLIGKAGVNSGNGKVQLATHTSSAGGIGFGTETQIYRRAAGHLAIDSNQGSTILTLSYLGNIEGYLSGSSSGGLTLAAQGATSLLLATNGTTALTLDSSQNATFAGTGKFATSVTISKTDNPYLLLRKTAATAVDWYLQYNTNGVELYGGTTPAAYFRVLDTGNATFTGSIAIGNTVAAAVGVASTHKVTISIGGTTYYLLATNV